MREANWEGRRQQERRERRERERGREGERDGYTMLSGSQGSE